MNHADYPMRDDPREFWPVAGLGRLTRTLPDLPEASIGVTERNVSRGRLAGYVAASFLPLVLLVVLLAFVRWPWAVAGVLANFGFYAVMQATRRRS